MNEGLALKSLTSVPEEEVFVFFLMILTNTTMPVVFVVEKYDVDSSMPVFRRVLSRKLCRRMLIRSL